MKLSGIYPIFCCAILSLCWSSYSPLLRADSVILKNNDKISGKLTSIDNQILTVKTTYAGTLSIDMRHMKALETNDYLWVRLQGQSTFKLIKFSSAEGKIWMNDSEGKKIPLVNQHNLARIAVKKPSTGWATGGNAGITFNSDDSSGDKQSYGSTGELVFKNPVHTHTVTWETYREKYNNVITSRKWNTGYTYKHYLDASVYMQGNGSWNYALSQTPQQLSTAGGGLGYNFWDDVNGKLQSDIGLNHLWEKYSDGKNESEWALRWNLLYAKTLYGRFNLYQEVNWLQPLKNGMILNTKTGLKIQIMDNLYANSEYNFNYTTQKDSTTTVGNKRLSHLINFGLGISW